MEKVDGSLEGMASALSKLARISRDMSNRPALIEEARKDGATWEQIAEAMQMSRAGVIKLYNAASTAGGRHGLTTTES